jgi:hypothetical protein
VHRPRTEVVPGRDPGVKTNAFAGIGPTSSAAAAFDGTGGDHVVRGLGSPLSSRPEPRIGQAWAVSQDGRLWEFGGRRGLVTPATPTHSKKTGAAAAAADAAVRGSGQHWGDDFGVGDMVSDLHMYARAAVPAWSGRPHGQGSNHAAMGGGHGGSGNGPHSGGVGGGDATRGAPLTPPEDLTEPLRQTYVYAGVVRGNGAKE